MVAVLVFVTVLNVAAVGYDLQPYYSPEFNPDLPEQWWTPISSVAISAGKANCDNLRLSLRDTFKTKLNLFPYTIDSLAYTSQLNNPTALRPTSFSYNGSALRDCTFHHLSMSVTQAESMTALKAHVSCVTADTDGDVQLNISTSLIMAPDRDKDTVYSRFLSEGGTFSSALYSNPTASPVLLTLMGLSVDVLNVMYVIPPDAPANVSSPTTRHRSYAYTPRPGRQWNWTEEYTYRGFQSGELYPFSLDSDMILNVIQNLFLVFPAAVLADLGSKDTLFRDWPRLSGSLSPAFNDTEARPVELRWAWRPAENLPSFESPFIQQFIVNPTALGINLPIPEVESAIIDASYFCRRWRRKPTSSFIAAVAAATTSFVLAIWGVYMLIAQWFAKRHYRAADASAGKNGKQQSQDGLAYEQNQVSGSSPDPEK